jgi:hypothetical protein
MDQDQEVNNLVNIIKKVFMSLRTTCKFVFVDEYVSVIFIIESHCFPFHILIKHVYKIVLLYIVY